MMRGQGEAATRGRRVSPAPLLPCSARGSQRTYAFAKLGGCGRSHSRALRRLALILPVLWAVVTLVFLLIHIVPGDPVRTLVGENASLEQYEAAKAELGLDKPLLEQYSRILERHHQGRLGRKFCH